jgi:hypothetical protein
MSDGSATEASQHRVFYLYDSGGIAQEWNYQGLYGKLHSRDTLFQMPLPSKQAP